MPRSLKKHSKKQETQLVPHGLPPVSCPLQPQLAVPCPQGQPTPCVAPLVAFCQIFLVITVMVLPSKESLTVLKHETLCLKFYVANNRENLAKLHNLAIAFSQPLS